MDWQTLVLAALRHLLTTAAGSLAAHGYIMSSETEQFIGAGMFFVGLAWSWYQKHGQSALQDELVKVKLMLAASQGKPGSSAPLPKS